MAQRLEELKVWQRAMDLWRAVNAIIDKPGLLADSKLREQIADAADSMVSNIAEGFEQPTDRAFSRYLYISKASTAEVRGRLMLAREKGHITPDEFAGCNAVGDEVAALTTGLIKYLVKSNRRDRGLGSKSPRLEPGRKA
jgi:four helix bundle protein